MSTARLHLGKVEYWLPHLEDESFDACLCDPPYGIGFMGATWDHGVPSAEVWAEVLRALKPGASIFAFGGTRTYHRLACAIEDSGFEIRDSIGVPGLAWVYGSGLPKSFDIRKATGEGCWEGYGTALKPAWEPVVWGMKPLAGTFAANAMRFGVAGVNVGAGRVVGAKPDTTRGAGGQRGRYGPIGGQGRIRDDGQGRWPSNLILVHHPECEPNGARRVKGDSRAGRAERGTRPGGFGDVGADRGSALPNGTLHGDQEMECWSCHPACLVAELDRQSGELTSGFMAAGTQREGSGYRGGLGSTVRHDTHGDSGGASRFFYQAKASPSERSGSKHPTLKPIDLCRYLAKLLLPPTREAAPRRLLVPFSGAGSEIIGALQAGWEEAVGIEMDPQWVSDAERRIREDAPLLNQVEIVHPSLGVSA